MAGQSIRQCPACKQTSKFRNDYKTCCKKGGGVVGSPSEFAPGPTPQQQVDLELEKLRVKKEGGNEKISILQERVLQLEKEKDALLSISKATPQIIDILPKLPSAKSESAMVLVWSDWHIEEEVRPESVSNKNEFNLDVADRRFANLLHGGLAWFNIHSQKTAIKTVVIAALGDFITGSIHEDLAESNLLPPTEAIYKAQGMLVTGIKFMLENTAKDVELVVVCHSGNHGRMTKKQRISTEAGNSLELYMFYTVRDFFKTEKRVKFVISTGYHSYVRFFEGQYEVRFHHGHMVNYQGGVGGLTIPVNKAIAQWNKAHSVNLDIFGHFHTRFDGGNFISNGALIGYSAYAVSIKASYEKPSQTALLINKEYGEKTAVMPIFLD